MYKYFLIVTLAFLSGCGQFTPQPPVLRQAPEQVLSTAQTEAFESGALAIGNWPEEEWWHLFHDPQLDALIERALEQHPQIFEAEARVRAACALRRRAGAPLFPTLDAVGDYTRIRNSKNGIFGLAPQFPLTYTQPEASFNFGYEFDFWLKNKNLIRAASGEVAARQAEAYSTALILSLSVAEAYFEFQTALARDLLAHDLLRNREKALALREKLKVHNLDDELDVNQNKGNLWVAQQFKDRVARDIAINRDELLALVAGDFNERVSIADMRQGLDQSFPLPATLPLDLLSHRPDLWAYRCRAEAAAAQICVARANFYPNINLLGFAGLQTITPSTFFQWASFYGSVWPAFHLPIFEGGALCAQYDFSQQEYAIAVAEYDAQVLIAVKEVLNALVSIQTAGQILQSAKEIEKVALNNYRLSKKRLQHHLDSGLTVLEYENAWLQARDAVLQSTLACLESRLALIRALGGGCEVGICYE